MPRPKVLKVALPKPLAKLFDYLPPESVSLDDVCIGARVRVPFGRHESIGFVIDKGPTSFDAKQLKAAIEVLDQSPLYPTKTWAFFLKAQQYYHHTLGEVLLTGLPKALREGEPVLQEACLPTKGHVHAQGTEQPPSLNTDQSRALDNIFQNFSAYGTFLLDGITGSGKTEIYLQVLAHCQAQKKSALVLLPEIALTPQTLARFKARLKGPLLLYHSKLTPKARYQIWSYVQRSSNVIVIGTRSALFLPWQNLDAIIVDEEHDASFKQQEGFKYSARDLAVLRGHLDQCPVILGSATPSFETLNNALQEKYHHLILPHRANQKALPSVDLIDIRHKKLTHGLSHQALEAIKQCLAQDQQVLIFLNRRGYAPTWMCFTCHWYAECDRCDARMTYHHQKGRLQCHHCEKIIRCIEDCPHCQAPMQAIGVGTERLEDSLSTHFPDTPIVRLDSDTTKLKGHLEEKLQSVQAGGAQILIGTQLIAKGHHFPGIALVVIVDVDGGLFSADFRAVERMGQLVTQVAGRAGRGEHPGKVLLQSAQPDHPLLQCLIEQGYPAFAQTLLEERKQTNLPPFSHLAIIRAQAKKPEPPENFLDSLKNKLKAFGFDVGVWGPSQSSLTRKQGFHRYQMMIQANSRAHLHQCLSQLNTLIESIPEQKKVRWSLDVDPIEIR